LKVRRGISVAGTPNAAPLSNEPRGSSNFAPQSGYGRDELVAMIEDVG